MNGRVERANGARSPRSRCAPRVALVAPRDDLVEGRRARLGANARVAASRPKTQIFSSVAAGEIVTPLRPRPQPRESFARARRAPASTSGSGARGDWARSARVAAASAASSTPHALPAAARPLTRACLPVDSPVLVTVPGPVPSSQNASSRSPHAFSRCAAFTMT